MAGKIRKLFKTQLTNSKTISGDEIVSGDTPSKIADIPTEPLPRDATLPTTSENREFAPELPQLEVGYSQSVGRQRQHNEDSLLVVSAVLAADEKFVPFGLYVIADGMGGHSQGEIASSLAARAVGSQITGKILPALIAPLSSPPTESILEIMETGLLEAHHLVMHEAPGSGTTLTAVLHLIDRLVIAHVGDSRAYAIRSDGTLQTLTRDHSLVMRMIEMGKLTEFEAATHPQRNVLYRALGQGDVLASDVTSIPRPDATWLMLCSDGLWGVVPPEEISNITTNSKSPQIACSQLVDAANAAGGPDNISVILIRLP